MDKNLLFLILFLIMYYFMSGKKSVEHMTIDSIGESLINKISIINESNDKLIKSNQQLINQNKEYETRIKNIEEKTINLTTSTSPGWGGWGKGITLNKAGQTTIYYPPGNMFIGLNGNRNLYVGNNKDGKDVLILDTKTGDLMVPGKITAYGGFSSGGNYNVHLRQDGSGDIQENGGTMLS